MGMVLRTLPPSDPSIINGYTPDIYPVSEYYIALPDSGLRKSGNRCRRHAKIYQLGTRYNRQLLVCRACIIYFLGI